MQLKVRGRRKALINVTALLDVVFLLLIFFVVTSTFLEQPGLDLSLPEASSADVATRDEVILRMTVDGAMFVGGQKVEEDALEQALRAGLAAENVTRVVLEADERVPHGQVVKGMDAARKAGATALIIATRPDVAPPDRP